MKSKLIGIAALGFSALIALSGCTKDDDFPDQPTHSTQADDKIDFSEVRGFDLKKVPDRKNADQIGKFASSVRVAYDPKAEREERNIYQFFVNNDFVTNNYSPGDSLYSDFNKDMLKFDGYAKIVKAEQTPMDDPVEDKKNEVYRHYTITADLVGTKEDTRNSGAKVPNSGKWGAGEYEFSSYVHLIRKSDKDNWLIDEMQVGE